MMAQPNVLFAEATPQMIPGEALSLPRIAMPPLYPHKSESGLRDLEEMQSRVPEDVLPSDLEGRPQYQPEVENSVNQIDVGSRALPQPNIQYTEAPRQLQRPLNITETNEPAVAFTENGMYSQTFYRDFNANEQRNDQRIEQRNAQRNDQRIEQRNGQRIEQRNGQRNDQRNEELLDYELPMRPQLATPLRANRVRRSVASSRSSVVSGTDTAQYPDDIDGRFGRSRSMLSLANGSYGDDQAFAARRRSLSRRRLSEGDLLSDFDFEPVSNTKPGWILFLWSAFNLFACFYYLAFQ